VEVFTEENIERMWNEIPRSELFTRVEISFNEKILGKTVNQVNRELMEGSPRIVANVYREGVGGKIIIYPQSLQPGEEKLVALRLKEILSI
jgi:hypothetical protein